MSEVLDAFMATAGRVVYASLATVDRRGRPRSRLVHPVWELTGEALVGWVGSRPTPMRSSHLEHSAFVSCHYWDAAHDVAVAECAAAWVPPGDRRAAWERLAAAPAPMGYDPAPIWPEGPESEGFAALRLDPWRVQVRSAAATAAGEPYGSWTPASTGA